MTNLASFDRIIEAYCKATGLAEATVSSRLFNDGKRISEVRLGADIGIRRVDKALEWLSRNWPAGVDWPENVARPLVMIPEAAE